MSISEKPLRGITSWERDPSQWDFELFETYKKLVSLDRAQLKNLDSPNLETAEKIAIHFADRSKGISIADAEIDLLRNTITRPLSDISNLPQNIAKASVVYEALHPVVDDLPEEMTQQIFALLENKKLVSAAHTTSKQTKTQIYNNISLERRIGWSKSEYLANKIMDPEERLGVLVALAQDQTAHGNIEGANRLERRIGLLRSVNMANEIRNPQNRFHVLVAHAREQAADGNREDAKRTVANARNSTVDRDWHKYDRDCAREKIVTFQLELGDMEGAIGTARMIDGDSSQGRAYCEIAQALVERGDAKGAIGFAEEIIDPADKSHAYSKIARAQARSGDLKAALGTLEKVYDPKHKGLAYSGIAQALARGGDIEGAIYRLEKIDDPKYKAFAYCAIVQAQLERRDVKGAIAFAEKIADPIYKASASQKIAQAQASSGSVKGGIS